MSTPPGASKTFAELLRQFRAKSRLSQADLAERANLSLRAISDLERGARRRPYLPTVQALADALGLDADESQQLIATTQRQHGRQPHATGEVPMAMQMAPLPISSFIGREDEMTELMRQLFDPESRLISVTGPPGVGKTRLVQEVARRLRSESAVHIVYFNLLPGEAAPSGSGRIATPSMEDLFSVIGATSPAKPCLLIVDNVSDPPPGHRLAEVLSGFPLLTILATSRSPLLIPGEQQMALAPLATPSAADLKANEESLRNWPAVKLLFDRLREHAPAIVSDGCDVRKIAEIAFATQGVPLTLEIVAGYSQLLSLHDLGEVVKKPLDLSASHARHGLDPRHQTLRKAIDWSYKLLQPADQWAFRQLSVLVGSYTIDDACDFLTDQPYVDLPNGVNEVAMERVLHLAQQGLLVRLESPSATVFSMLHFIRDYAFSQLESSGELAAAGRALIKTAMDFSENAAAQLDEVEAADWRSVWERRRATIVTALQFCLEVGQVGDGATILWNLRHLFLSGRQDWASRWIEEALRRPGVAEIARAKLFILSALLYIREGRREIATEHTHRGMAMLPAEGAAIERLEAFDLLRPFLHGPGLDALGEEADAALELYLSQIGRLDVRAKRGLRARAIRRLASGELELAEADFAYIALLPYSDAIGRVSFMRGLAAVRIAQSRLQDAKTLLLDTLSLGESNGLPSPTMSHAMLAFVLEGLNDTPMAESEYRKALTLNLTASIVQSSLPFILKGIARLAAKHDFCVEATRLLGASMSSRLDHGFDDIFSFTGSEELASTLRRQLGEVAFDMVHQEGTLLGPEQMVSESLAILDRARSLSTASARGPSLRRRRAESPPAQV